MATTVFTEFAKVVTSALESRLPDFEISEQSVTKHNDITLHGLTFRRKGSDTAPTLYLDSLYDAFRFDNKSIESIVDTMVDTVLQSEPIAPISSALELDMSLDAIRDKLTLRLVDSELNQKYLQSHPYGLVGAGLAVVAELNISDNYRCVITKDLAEQNGLNMSEIFEIARENMEHSYPATLMSMDDALFGKKVNILDGDGTLDAMGTLMTDGEHGFGAIAIAYLGIAEKIRNIVGNYFILPSSLHELIILPDNGSYDTAELKNMVVNANKTVVDDCDVLSNSVFYYGTDGVLSRVA